jgi:hypothetical protein
MATRSNPGHALPARPGLQPSRPTHYDACCGTSRAGAPAPVIMALAT